MMQNCFSFSSDLFQEPSPAEVFFTKLKQLGINLTKIQTPTIASSPAGRASYGWARDLPQGDAYSKETLTSRDLRQGDNYLEELTSRRRFPQGTYIKETLTSRDLHQGDAYPKGLTSRKRLPQGTYLREKLTSRDLPQGDAYLKGLTSRRHLPQGTDIKETLTSRRSYSRWVIQRKKRLKTRYSMGVELNLWSEMEDGRVRVKNRIHTLGKIYPKYARK